MDSFRKSFNTALTSTRERLSSLSTLGKPTPEELPVVYPSALNLAPNDSGSDFIIGAPHGNSPLFQQIVDLLRANDRLFVCGNIVNRDPQSWELINCIEEQRSAGKQIYIVRGNHENMVLKALENWDAVVESESTIERISILNTANRMIQARDMEENVLYLQGIKDSELNAYLLINGKRLIWTMPIDHEIALPRSGTEIRHAKGVQNFISTYGYAANTVNTIRSWILKGHSYPYTKKEKTELYQKLFHASSEKDNFFANFSAYLYNLTLNGGAWALDLTNERRKKVIHFIRPLPYLIRVHEQFDCVHAAPPEENVIQRLLSGDQPSENEIKYMTWAKISTDDTQMLPNGRTRDSLRAYTAHNPLYGNTQSIEGYHNWNIIVVNPGTFLSQTLIVVNHTDSLVFSVTGEAKPKNEIKSLQEVVNIIQSYLRVDLKRLTSTTAALLNWEQTYCTEESTLGEACKKLEHSDMLDLLETGYSISTTTDKKINWRFYRDKNEISSSDEEETQQDEKTKEDHGSTSNLRPQTPT